MTLVFLHQQRYSLEYKFLVRVPSLRTTCGMVIKGKSETRKPQPTPQIVSEVTFLEPES